MKTKPLLEVRNLKTHFFTHNGVAKAVDDVSFDIAPGEMVGIVGESGSGKSVTARSIMRIVPTPPGKIVGGSITFDGRALLELSDKQMQDVRGNQISMIFQEPMTALNPVYTVGYQLREVILKHQQQTKAQALALAEEMLRLVGIASPDQRLREYPFQMSGGMRQRVIIAMALACRPKLILADEPTTALDVTIQAQILKLIRELSDELGTAMLLITHDLGVTAETVERVLVMYAGQVVEEAPADDLFGRPLHPYTDGLMTSMPSLSSDLTKDSGQLTEIPGVVPNLTNLPGHCYFYARCPKRTDRCQQQIPKLKSLDNGRKVRCILYE
ncbi:MAG: ABC transporter ATP-binding protein [Desulfobacterales bacterium]|jgi:oligopeptide/dipeptide ABC transporter ATP-binding protein